MATERSADEAPHTPADEAFRAPADEAFRAAWVAELERLEIDVAAAEQLLAADHAEAQQPAAATGPGSPWSAPRIRGPVPADLEPRARLVLERQLAVAALLTERLTATGRHRRLTERLRSTAHADVPVYLDLQA